MCVSFPCNIIIYRRTNIEVEFQRIKENFMKSSSENVQIQPRELLKGSVLKPLGISMAIMFFQQFTGINAMIFYTVSIFKSAGTTLDSRYATIIIGFVQLIATACSGFLVRKLLINFSYKTFCISKVFELITLRSIALDDAVFYSPLLRLCPCHWQPWELSSTCRRNGERQWLQRNWVGFLFSLSSSSSSPIPVDMPTSLSFLWANFSQRDTAPFSPRSARRSIWCAHLPS